MTPADASANPLTPHEPPFVPVAVWPQTLVGVGVFLTGLALAYGALSISGEAGYGGVGPNFLPWMVSVVLTLCGAWIIWESRTGGLPVMMPPSITAPITISALGSPLLPLTNCARPIAPAAPPLLS